MHSSVRFAMLSLVGVLFASSAADAAPPAQTIVDTAIQKATAENKAVFVHFSASW